jgi:hypothetical protein
VSLSNDNCITTKYDYNESGVYMKPIRLLLLSAILLLATACGSGSDTLERSGPRLVSVATLDPTASVVASNNTAPTTVINTVVTLTPLPDVEITETALPQLSVVAIDSDIVLVTPTLPPSKTPTETPTQTLTFTPTRTPSVTPSITATLLIAPVIAGQSTAISINPASVNCPYNWFFSNPQPNVCPLGGASIGSGSILYFERGFMVWVEAQDAIYVFFNDVGSPRWQVFNDAFDAGLMPESDPSFDVNVPPLSWQPRRGFGLIWREQTQARDRIGWAIQESETSYNVPIQASPDGVIYMGLPNSGVVSLSPTGNLWQSF